MSYTKQTGSLQNQKTPVGRKIMMAVAFVVLFGCGFGSDLDCFGGGSSDSEPSDPLTFTWSQNPVLFNPSEQKNITFSAEYVNHSVGGQHRTYLLHALVGGPFTVTPNEVSAEFPGTQGGNTFASEFIVIANANAAPDAVGYLNVSYLEDGKTFETEIELRVRPAQETGTHSITADPVQISTPNNTPSEQFITFTISSLNGYTGPIKVSYSTTDFVYVMPPDNDIIVNVSPGNPAIFNRNFYRDGGPNGTAPYTLRFTALNEATTEAKSIDITVNHSQ